MLEGSPYLLHGLQHRGRRTGPGPNSRSKLSTGALPSGSGASQLWARCKQQRNAPQKRAARNAPQRSLGAVGCRGDYGCALTGGAREVSRRAPPRNNNINTINNTTTTTTNTNTNSKGKITAVR